MALFSKYELNQAPGVPLHDVVEVSNYVAALEYGISRLQSGFPLCNRLICELHERLRASSRGSGKALGQFRTIQNWIGGSYPSQALFVPPPPHAVDKCMGDLEKFLHSQSIQNPLVKAALAHVQFETIHPFLDKLGSDFLSIMSISIY